MTVSPQRTYIVNGDLIEVARKEGRRSLDVGWRMVKREPAMGTTQSRSARLKAANATWAPRPENACLKIQRDETRWE